MAEILFKELSFKIIGCAMEVHRTLGPGFLEAVYLNALTQELSLLNISFEMQKHLPVYYKGKLAGEYIADIIVDDKIILELKAVSRLNSSHTAQALNYLTATGLRLAIIINFGSGSLQSQRVVR